MVKIPGSNPGRSTMVNKSYDIIGIGSLTIDIFTDSKFYMIESDKRGIEKYIMFPLGKKTKGKVYIHSGGSSGNTVSYLSKLGLKTGYFTKLGKDKLSEFMIMDMKNHGVDMSNVIQQRGLEVGRSLILISEKTKDTTLIVDHGSASELTVNDVKKKSKFIFSSKWLDITSFTGKSAVNSIKYIFDSKIRKGKIFFAPSRTMIYQFPKEVKKLLMKADASSFNIGEFELLFGKFSIEKLRALKSKGLKNCFITLGKNGIMYFDAKNLYIAKSFKVADVKNTTGAGDCAAAWFIYGLINHLEPEKILKYASAAGAIHVQSKYIGAKSGNPTESEIKKFINGKKFSIKKKII